MDGDSLQSKNVTSTDDHHHLAHTSPPLKSDDAFSERASKGAAEDAEQEIDTQTHQDSVPHSKKRTRVDDDDDDDDDAAHSDHSHTSRHHSPHAHVHKHKRNSPPSASMRLYRRSLSLALRHARKQPITRSLTMRLTRSGAKFFNHDLDIELPSTSSRSANLHGEHLHTPTSPYGSPLHGSPKRNNIKHADARASPSKSDLNHSPEKFTGEDAMLKVNEDIAIRYLNSSPSFHSLLDLDFKPSDELKASSASPLPNKDPLYLGPEKDVAITYDGSSPKLKTIPNGMNFDVLHSPTPRTPKASSPIVENSHVRPHSAANLKCSLPSTRASSSSSSQRVHNLQDQYASKPRPSSTTSFKFKRHAGKSMDVLLSSRAPLPSPSPSPSPSLASPNHGPSGESINLLSSLRSRRSSRSPSLSYSPASPKYTRPSGKSITRLLATRSPSPSYSPASLKYTPSSSQDSPNSFSSLQARSPSYSPTPSYSKSSSPGHNSNLLFSSSPSQKGKSPCYSPASSHSESSSSRHNNHLFPSRSPSPKHAPTSHMHVPSPSLSDIQKGKLPCVPSFKPSKPRTFKFKGPDSSSSSSFTAPRKHLRSGSPVSSHPLRSRCHSPRPPSSLIPPFHQKESHQTSLRAPLVKYSTNVDELFQSLSPYWNKIEPTSSSPAKRRPSNQSALNHPSSRARSPSLSSQGSPTSSALVDPYSQVRPTYSLYPLSSPKRARTNHSSAHLQIPRLPDLNLSPSCQFWLPSSTSDQNLPSSYEIWSQETSPSLPSSSTQSPHSPPGQRHVSFSPRTNIFHDAHSGLGEQRANPARTYRKTPHRNYLQPSETAGSSETLSSIESTCARRRGRKSSGKGAQPRQVAHGVPSPTSSEKTSYYSALSSPSGWGDVSSCYQGAAPSSRMYPADISGPTSSPHTSFRSALRSPSWYQGRPSDTSTFHSALSSPSWYQDEPSHSSFHSALSSPSWYRGRTSDASFHSALSSPSWYQDGPSHTSFHSALSSPSWYQGRTSRPSASLHSPAAAAQETYYSAQSAPLSSQTSYHTAPCAPSWYQPSLQETYFSAQSKLSAIPKAIYHAMLDLTKRP